MVSVHASGIALAQLGRGIIRQARSRWPTDPRDGGFRSSVSCCTSIGWQIAVELAEQGIPIFFGPVSEMSNEVFDLLSGGFAQSFDCAKIRRIGLHQIGIELMPADDLAQAIADFGAAVVPVSRLRRELARLSFKLRSRSK